jgi:hypothetical protein
MSWRHGLTGPNVPQLSFGTSLLDLLKRILVVEMEKLSVYAPFVVDTEEIVGREESINTGRVSH